MGRKRKHVHVVSVSGGRTSGFLAYLIKNIGKEKDWRVEYLFCDTGAEHPETYEFLRNIQKHFHINITCIRAVTHPDMGVGNTYKKVSIKYIKHDLAPWVDMCKKYGLPGLTAPFCTDKMKTVPSKKYCDDTFGVGNYTLYLGMRIDEPSRLKQKPNVVYLAELSDFDKSDVLDWWSEQPFDLNIPEYLGNCVFCIKKSVPKLVKAVQSSPSLADQWLIMLNDPENRISLKDMYRNYNTLESLIDKAQHLDSSYLSEYLEMNNQESGSCCSSSCEPFQ